MGFHGGEISFRPRLPDRFARIRFRLQVRGQRLDVALDHAGTSYTLLDGGALTIRHEGEELSLTPGEALHRPAVAPG